VPRFVDEHGCAERPVPPGGGRQQYFRLQDVSTPAPLATGSPSAWPAPWQENFRVTTAQISDAISPVRAAVPNLPAATPAARRRQPVRRQRPGFDLIAWLDGVQDRRASARLGVALTIAVTAAPPTRPRSRRRRAQARTKGLARVL
jgi:hypothetical protein